MHIRLFIGAALALTGLMLLNIERKIGVTGRTRLGKYKEKTVATVVDIWENHSNVLGSSKYVVEYKCFPNGVKRLFQWNTNIRYRIDDMFPLYYDASNPEDQLPIGEAFARSSKLRIIAGVCLAAVGVVIMVLETFWPTQLL